MKEDVIDKEDEFVDYRHFTDDETTDICEYPYIGIGEKPFIKKNKRSIPNEEELEKMTL